MNTTLYPPTVSTPDPLSTALHSNTNVTPVNLPSRFQERTFRQYEMSIATAVNNWPKATRFTPRNSVETFAARFRDACRSYNEHNWKSTEIKRDKFLAAFPYFKTSIVAGGFVVVSDKRDRILAVAEPVEVMAETNILKNRLNSPSQATLEAMIAELTRREIEPPLEVLNPDPAQLDWIRNLPNQYDVAVEILPTHNGTLVRIF